MATVRITQTLRHQVFEHIKQLYNIRETKIREEMISKLGDFYDCLVPKQFQKYAAEMGPKYCVQGTHLHIQIGEIKYHMKFEGGARMIPADYSSNWSPYIIVASDLANKELGVFATDVTTRITNLHKERDLLIASARNMMDSYPSLARLIEAWPSIMQLLPKDIVQKHYAVLPKKEKFDPKAAPILSEEARIALITTTMLVPQGVT